MGAALDSGVVYQHAVRLHRHASVPRPPCLNSQGESVARSPGLFSIRCARERMTPVTVTLGRYLAIRAAGSGGFEPAFFDDWWQVLTLTLTPNPNPNPSPSPNPNLTLTLTLTLILP